MTFEDLGFLLPDEDLNDEQKAAQGEARVSIAFKGPFDGELVVRLYGGVLPGMTANMLGEMEPPEVSMQNDAFGEIANVICGNALPVIAGSRQVFDLGAPEVERLPQGSWKQSGQAPAAEISLGLEEGRAEVLLYVH